MNYTQTNKYRSIANLLENVKSIWVQKYSQYEYLFSAGKVLSYNQHVICIIAGQKLLGATWFEKKFNKKYSGH